MPPNRSKSTLKGVLTVGWGKYPQSRVWQLQGVGEKKMKKVSNLLAQTEMMLQDACMETPNTPNTPNTPESKPEWKYIVTRIGNGAKLHLSYESSCSNRLYPSCGRDNCMSHARKTGRDFKDISCTNCRNKAIKLGLITA